MHCGKIFMIALGMDYWERVYGSDVAQVLVAAQLTHVLTTNLTLSLT
jgi:hypothetical protein